MIQNLSEWQGNVLEILISNPEEPILLSDVADVFNFDPKLMGLAAGLLLRKGLIHRTNLYKTPRHIWLTDETKQEIL